MEEKEQELGLENLQLREMIQTLRGEIKQLKERVGQLQIELYNRK